jgi:hypothetical protein
VTWIKVEHEFPCQGRKLLFCWAAHSNDCLFSSRRAAPSRLARIDPMHLLTREAFAVYLSELNSDGVLALHITNGYLDLRAVIKQLASYYKLFG